MILSSGCARLPGTVDIGETDRERVTRQFKEMVAEQHQCRCCLDVQATVTVSSIWQKGAMSGYLQAMSPCYLKFTGLNPLGQPQAILVTDGKKFTYVSVAEATEYTGDVGGESFARYAPEGFSPEHGFYWLTGRLHPGKIKILQVSRDKEELGYWFEITYGENTKSLILFAEEKKVLLRHIVLNADNKKILNVFYDDFSDAPCALPGKITVTSLIHNSSMELRLADWLPDVSFAKKDFHYISPSEFKRVVVK